jgi:type IV pilus assembly protein PilE
MGLAIFDKREKVANESAFSMMELITVLVIVGVLASIALPRYEVGIEKIRSSEGAQILTALLDAQKRYSSENGGAYTATMSDLDVTIPASSNFNAPTVSASSPLATIQRIDGSSGIDDYTLTISDTGTVSCSGGGGGICGKMGY